MNRSSTTAAATVVILTLLSTPVWAQDTEPATPADAPTEAPAATPTEAPTTEAPAPAQDATPDVADGVRYRWGIAASGGLEKVSIVSGPMVGMDLRLGAQLNDLLGLYLQSHLSFGKLSSSGAGGAGVVSGFTGTLTAAAMADVTIMDRFFAGAGFGYGVLNNPSGPMFQARAGAYPLSSRIKNSIRRRGLMVGVDVRTIFIEGATGLLVLGSIGFEKF